MPAFELTSPEGKKYRVEGPEGATQEDAYRILQQQLAGQSGNTMGGDILRGLAHGAASSAGMSGMVGDEPTGPSETWARWGGERVGGAIPPLAAGLIPGGPLVKGAIGAGMGALQPASGPLERGENMLIGGGSALGGQALGSAISSARGPLNTLANEAIGSAFGASHLGPWGGYGGIWAGRGIGHQLQQIFGGRGLADLLAAAARNPGLAAYLGIQAAPGAEQAGQWVGEELGKPAQ